ncbi:MAG: DapH/DapD/GlmU-related protein [Rhodothermales bacterium]
MLKVLRHTAALISGWWGAALQHNPSVAASILRRKRLGTSCLIDTGVTIVNANTFTAGTGCALYHGTYVLNTQGSMTMGENSHLGALCYVNVCHGSLSIGDDVAIGPHTSMIVYSNHYKEGTKVTEERIQQDIVIGNNVFVGAHCTILPGTVIGDHVVIGAGSVVKGTLEGPAIYAGAPCKKIRDGWA